MAVAKEKKKETREAEKNKISTLLEDLSSLESYAEDLFSFLPLPVCLISLMGIILDVNPAFEEITGYKAEEIIGSPAEKIFNKKEIEELSKKTLKKGFVRLKETAILTKEKKEIPVSVSTTLRKTEKEESVGYFLGFFSLTEIKKREEELKNVQTALINMLEDVEESRKALTNVLEDIEEARKRAEEERDKTNTIIINLADGLLVFDKENRLSLINPQAEDFFDVKGKNIIGRAILELGTFPTIEPLVKLIGPEIKGVFRKELLIKEKLTLEVSTVPMIKEEEKLGTLVILHDITREKIVERMKTEFVSISAHQLRTPLSAIKWTLRMLLDGDLGQITKEQKEFIEKTYSSNERMIALINDLLNVTRIEEGRFLYQPILTDIESVVQFVTDSYQEQIKKKNLKFEFKRPENKLPRVSLDVEKMRLAIQNLLDNAIRYTPTGGQVTVSLKHLKKEIEFSIRDTGVGIPKDQQERIFSKFFRGANVRRMETEGSGLGLFITKNIIEAHGGKIWFESKEGKGTTFYFSLPVKEEFSESLKEF